MYRLLTPTDAPAYKHLRLMALQTDPRSYISTYEYEARQSDRFFVDAIFQNHFPPLFGYYGVFKKEELIGYVMLERHFGKESHHASFINLYIHPDFRKQGVAKQLLTHIIEKAKSELDVLYVTCASDNHKALALYKTFGFSQYGIEPKYLKHPDGSYQDKSLLYLELKEYA